MGYFDLDIVGEDYFVDPYEIEHPVIEKMGTTPDWEELYTTGTTFWYDKFERYSFMLVSNRNYECVSLDIYDENMEDWEEKTYDNFACIGYDCFGEICCKLLDKVDEQLERYA